MQAQIDSQNTGIAAKSPLSPHSSHDMLLGIVLIVLIIAELVARPTGWFPARLMGWAMAVLTLVAARKGLGFRERYLVFMSAAATVLAFWLVPDKFAVMSRGLDTAIFLMSFFLLLGILKEAAATSPSVETFGRYVTQQKPLRRFSALFVGAGFLSVLFNLGVISFFVPLIQRGVQSASPDSPFNAIKERRQITSLQRGFAWAAIWSPTAIAPLVIVELIPGVDRQKWIAAGFGIFILMLILGALEDYVRHRAYRPNPDAPTPPVPWMAILAFASACACLFGLAFGVASITGENIVYGVLVSCPFLVAGWFFIQIAFSKQRDTSRSIAGQLGQRIWDTIFVIQPRSATLAVTFGASGYLGSVAAALLPAESIMAALHLDMMPDYLLLTLIPVAISALSLLALSPIVMAVFFGSLFGAMPQLPADATWIALSTSCGWAVSMTFSPFATVVLLTSRTSGISARRLTWEWNLLYSLLAVLLLLPVFAVLTALG